MKISLFHVLCVAVSFTLIANGMNENSKPIILDFQLSKLNIISRAWKVEQVLLNDTIERTSDFINYSFEFKNNGTYILNRPESPFEGTWQFINNETQLILNENTPQEEIVNIVLLSKTQLHIEYKQASSITGLQKAAFKLK